MLYWIHTLFCAVRAKIPPWDLWGLIRKKLQSSRGSQAALTRLHPPPCPRCSSQQRYPFLSHHSPTSQVALVGPAGSGCGGIPRPHGSKPCIPIHPASSKTFLVSGEKHPQTCPQPPRLSLTLHFHISFSHFFLSGPSFLLSLVPSCVNGCDSTWLKTTRAAWK